MASGDKKQVGWAGQGFSVSIITLTSFESFLNSLGKWVIRELATQRRLSWILESGEGSWRDWLKTTEKNECKTRYCQMKWIKLCWAKYVAYCPASGRGLMQDNKQCVSLARGFPESLVALCLLLMLPPASHRNMGQGVSWHRVAWKHGAVQDLGNPWCPMPGTCTEAQVGAGPGKQV